MISEKKFEELNDKIEEINSKIELMDQKFIVIIDLLYTIRSVTIDKLAQENNLDSSDWLVKLAEVYPSMNKFKKFTNRTYVSHGEYMNNLYIATNKYNEDFSSRLDTNEDDSGTEGPEMIDKNSY